MVARTVYTDVLIRGYQNVGYEEVQNDARLDVAGGDSAIAPLKIGIGGLTSVPRPGAIENVGDDILWTDSFGIRHSLLKADTDVDSALNVLMYGKASLMRQEGFSGASAGWYRVAQSKVAVGANEAVFRVYERTYDCIFTVTACISNTSEPTLVVNAVSGYNASGLTKVRVVYKEENQEEYYAYLEVYKAGASAQYIMVESVEPHGWDLVPPVIPGGVPDGCVTVEAEIGMGGIPEKVASVAVNSGTYYITGVAEPNGVQSFDYDVYFNASDGSIHSSAIESGNASFTGTLGVTSTVTLSALGAGVVHSNASGVLTSGKVAMASEVSGILPVANGGTGRSSITAGALLYGNGTGVASVLGIATSGYILKSNGSAPAWSTLADAGIASTGHNHDSVYLKLSGGDITGSLGVASSVTFSSLGAGVVHSNASGVLSSSAVALGSDVSGTLPVANGGTGITSYAKGNIIYATGNTALTTLAIGSQDDVLVVSSSGIPSWVSKAPKATLADTVTTAADTTNTLYVVGVKSGELSTLKHDTSVMVKGGTITATTFSGSLSGGTISGTTLTASGTVTFTGLGTTAGVVHNNASGVLSSSLVSLTADITGTLTVSHGGTGATTLTANRLLLGNGTSAISVLAQGTNDYVLVGRGTSAPAWVALSTIMPTLTLDDVGDGTTRKLANYLPLAGGTMTGSLKWEGSTALPAITSPQYILAIDAFADGGATKYVTIANLGTAIGLGNYLPLAGLKTVSGLTTFSAGLTVSGGNLTVKTLSGALYGDSGVVKASSTTATELGYVHGVTSAIQTQLDNKVTRYRVYNRDTNTTWNGTIPLWILSLKNGYPLYTDTEFETGSNSVSAYRTTATVSRVLATSEAGIASAETGTGVGSSSYVLKVVATGEAGFVQTINSKENKVFVQIFRAWLPVGYKFVTAANGTGDGRKDEYLTNPNGTGKWEWYVRTMYCGVGGTFSSTGHNYITRVSSDYDLPSSENPVTFYLAECNAYDVTRGGYAGLRVRYADSATSSTGVTVTNDETNTLYFTGVKSSTGTALFNTTGISAKGSALSAGSVKATGLLESDTGLQINAGNDDKYITFKYSSTGYDWRIGYESSGSGNANYLVIESDGTAGTSWSKVLRMGLTDHESTFYGVVQPDQTNTRDLGTSSLKWANVYATKFNGEATNVTTTEDTSNALYVVGVTSGATTALKRDTSVTVTGGTLNATTLVGTTVRVGGSSGAILKYADSTLQVRNNADSDWGAVKVGNLTVEGTITYINTQDLNVADNIITLNSDVTGTPSENAGIEIERGTSTNASLLWDESNDCWKAGLVGSEKTLLFADFSNVSGTLTVANGGTGVSSLTAYRLLVGNGTNAIGVLGVATSGYVLVGAGTSANPTWKSLSDAGIASTGHNHDGTYLKLAGGETVAGLTTFTGGIAIGTTGSVSWATVSSKTPYMGYSSGQTDGTFVIASLSGTGYTTGLAIGGSSGKLLWKSNEVLTTASSANPSASIGLTTVNGSATTFMRSDAAPALSQAIAPTWTGLHTFSGGVYINNTAGSWVSGMTQTKLITFKTTDSSNYYPYMRGLTKDNHVWNWGGYANTIGVYGYYAGRTANSYDWRTYWDVSTGKLTHTKDMSVSGAVGLSSTLEVTGATTLSNTLGVTGATTLSSTLDVTGQTTLTGDLSATGVSTIQTLLTDAFTVNPGALLTTPVSGRVENDGTALYYTDATGTRYKLGSQTEIDNDLTDIWDQLSLLNNRAWGERMEYEKATAAGWYRIAQLQDRTSASGYFRVSDNTSGSEVLFTAAVKGGTNASLVQVGCAGTTISKARIVYTNGYAFLDVYSSDSTIRLFSVEVIGHKGWKLVSNVPGNYPSGYSTQELTFQSNAIVAPYLYGDGSNITNLPSGSITGIVGATHGGTGLGSVTKGDLLYGSATDTWDRLGIGSNGYILKSDGTKPVWSPDVYVKLAGSTWTGVMTALGSQYTDSRSGALNMNNSNIYGVNSVIFADKCDNAAEGLQWYRGTDTVDSVWVKDGVMYLTPNRTLGTTTATDYVFLTSGNYTSYVKDGTLHIQASGTDVTTFTANQTGASTFNIATGSTNGTISVGGTDVAVKGLGSNAYSSTSYLPLAGGSMTGVVTVGGAAYVAGTGGQGLLAYKPTNWTGVTNAQWAVGTVDSQGIIRSSNTDLIHYKSGVGSTAILDASNFNTYAPTLTGTGASGSWGIDITGTATNATNISVSSVTTKLYVAGFSTVGTGASYRTMYADASVYVQGGTVGATTFSGSLSGSVSGGTVSCTTLTASSTVKFSGITTSGLLSISSGTVGVTTKLDISQLPTGTGSTQVALGDHTHAAGTITGVYHDKVTLHSGSYTSSSLCLIDRNLVDFSRANKMAFIPADKVTIEFSTNGGSTWTDAGYTNAQKAALFAGNIAGSIRACGTTGDASGITSGHQTKIDITLPSSRYCSMEQFFIWFSGPNSQYDVLLDVYVSTYGAQTTFTKIIEDAQVKGDSGPNMYWFTRRNFWGTNQSAHVYTLRFIFKVGPLKVSEVTRASVVYDIRGYGPNCWSSANSMMKVDHLYSWDTSQNATFPANLTVKGITTAGVVHSNSSGLLSSGKVALASEVDGILPIANGGFGTNAGLTGVVIGSGSGYSAQAGSGNSVTFLAWNGTGYDFRSVSSAGTADSVTTTANTSDTLYVLGVKSGATSTILRNTGLTMKNGTLTGDLSGNASTADAWKTGRTITLSGGVTGTSASWTGSENLTITTTLSSHASTGTTYGAASASNYGHAKASSTLPVVAGTATTGTETSSFARGDHVHPAQTSVTGSSGSCTGNAASATLVSVTGLATNGNVAYYLTGVQTHSTSADNRSLISTKNVTVTGAGSVSMVNLNATGIVTLSGVTTVAGIVKISSAGKLSAGAIDLATEVGGTLPVGNGGLGTTNLSGILVGNGANVATAISTSNADGKYLKYVSGTGYTWASVSSSASGANPSKSIGLTTVNGSATTFMRSDAAPALSQAIEPVWSAMHTFQKPIFGIMTTDTNKRGIYRNLAHYTGGSSETGMVIIKTGITSDVKRVIHIDVYTYEDDKSGSVTVCFESDTSFKHSLFKTTIKIPEVKLGKDSSGYYYVTIGTTSSSWKYAEIAVSDVLSSHYNGTGVADVDWTITISSTAPTLSTTKTPNATIGVPEPASTDTDKYLKYTSSGLTWATVSGGTGVSSLAGLDDTSITSPTRGAILYYNSSSKWANLNKPSSSYSGKILSLDSNGDPSWITNTTTLSGLTDTTISNPANNQILYYNGSKWTQLTAPSTANTYLKYDGSSLGWATVSSGTGATLLSSLGDVSITPSSLVSNQLLYYDASASAWKPLVAPTTANTYLKYSSNGLEWATVSGGGGATALSGLSDVSLSNVAQGDLLWNKVVAGDNVWTNLAGGSDGYILKTGVSSGVKTLSWTNIAPQASQVRITGVNTTSTTKYYLTGHSGINTASTYARSLYTPRATATTSPYFTPAGEVGFNSLKLNGNAGLAGQVLGVNSDGTGVEWLPPGVFKSEVKNTDSSSLYSLEFDAQAGYCYILEPAPPKTIVTGGAITITINLPNVTSGVVMLLLPYNNWRYQNTLNVVLKAYGSGNSVGAIGDISSYTNTGAGHYEGVSLTTTYTISHTGYSASRWIALFASGATTIDDGGTSKTYSHCWYGQLSLNAS